MNKTLLIGGPLILFTWFSLHSDLITFGEQSPGIMHIAGAEKGGTFALVHEETYQCDENGNNCVLIDEKTEVTEVEETQERGGVSVSPNYRLEEQSSGFGEVGDLEPTLDPIEYREGDEITTVRKLNGMNKYGPIYLRRGGFSDVDFNWKGLRFEFERLGEIKKINEEYDEKIEKVQVE